jgi:regulatory protein
VHKDLVATTLATAYDDVDEVGLARQYIARKRMKQPSGPDAQKQTVRAMGRLMRAGFSSSAIFKVLREWHLPEEAMIGIEEGGGDSDSYADRDATEVDDG